MHALRGRLSPGRVLPSTGESRAGGATPPAGAHGRTRFAIDHPPHHDHLREPRLRALIERLPSMVKVNSLKLRIFAQFVIIIAPIMLVLIYQSVADLERASAIERVVERHTLALVAKDEFESFVTLASDAVETGSLGQRAYAAFRKATAALSSLGAKDGSAAATAALLDTLAGQVSAGMPLPDLLARQPQIRQARDAIKSMEHVYDDTSQQAVANSIRSARFQSMVVAIAAAVTLLLAAWFIYEMIIGVTKPLTAAVDLAGRIAAGEFAEHGDKSPVRDLGNLLESLYRMSDKLRQSQQEIEDYQRGLEQRVEERTAEVKARTEELTRSVEEMRILGEVGRAVSSTLDLESVLLAIITHAVKLSDADAGTIYEYDEAGEFFVPHANYGVSERLAKALHESRIGLGDSTVGLCVVERAPVQRPDVAQLADYRFRDLMLQDGIHALLAVPLLREDRVIGALVIRRRKAGEFSTSTLTLLQTLASQSVLAIENARLFKEVRAKSEQLEIASRLKSQFLANMSHELRTPLNAIIGVTEMLQEDARDLKRDDEFEPLDRVLRAARHLLALINDILDLSKIEAGKMEIHIESFAVAPLIDDVVHTINALTARNGNRIVVNCDPNIGTMRSDQTRIRQALLNLASNADKFTERGTVTIEARRTIGGARDWVTMSVADTGIGLTPEQVGRLFQDFVQADATTTRKYGGTGLGLAISRRFCQMLGGDITVQSEPGHGSTFTIRLPADVGPAQASAPEVVASAARPPTQSTRGSLVLVIDDDESVRDLTGRFLTRDGFTVVTANGGKEGLRLARELHPAAITLDVMMPDLDGWTVLAAIKGDPELSDIPVVLMTIVDDKNRGYALGATGYMIKPVNRDELARVLRNICGPVGRNMLLVDDDDTMRKWMRKVLEPDGWVVVEAENGRVALTRLAEASPDVIVLDLMMPEMDGFEFLVEMRRHAQWQNIPVLIVTAKDLTDDEQRRLDGDVTRVLQKGAPALDELLREISRSLSGSIERSRAAKGARGSA